MEIISIEHVYTVEGTEKEAREYRDELQPKYETVTMYSTPYDHRIVAHTPIN